MYVVGTPTKQNQNSGSGSLSFTYKYHVCRIPYTSFMGTLLTNQNGNAKCINGTRVLRVKRKSYITITYTVYFIVLDPPMYTAVTEFD